MKENIRQPNWVTCLILLVEEQPSTHKRSFSNSFHVKSIEK